MNKQLIKDLSQELVDKFELDKKQANSFVEKMFSVLQDGLQDEKIVKIAEIRSASRRTAICVILSTAPSLNLRQ